MTLATEVTHNLVEKVAADLRDNGVRARWLHEMGEPLLYPRLAEAIELFPGAGVSTNVMMLDEGYARELLRARHLELRYALMLPDELATHIQLNASRINSYEKIRWEVTNYCQLKNPQDPVGMQIDHFETYDEGYDDGYSDGFYQGYLSGYTTWYDAGYEDGS